MNISFDLDNTLIPYGNEFDTEKRSKLAKLLGVEKIRKGTANLISYLQAEGHIIHVYTTSFRKKRMIRRTLRYYGISVNKIVTQTENQRKLEFLKINASKYPKAFNFDLHIDDLKGVRIESEKYGFNAIIIEPEDKDWIKKIKEEVRFIKQNS